MQPMRNHATGHLADAVGIVFIVFWGFWVQPVGAYVQSAYQGRTSQSANPVTMSCMSCSSQTRFAEVINLRAHQWERG